MPVEGQPVDRQRLRRLLEDIAATGSTRTYHQVVRALGLKPPHSIHRLALALEELMDEDAAAGRPLLPAVVVSRAGPGLPAAGFFTHAARLGRYRGQPENGGAAAFHAEEVTAVHAFYRSDVP